MDVPDIADGAPAYRPAADHERGVHSAQRCHMKRAGSIVLSLSLGLMVSAARLSIAAQQSAGPGRPATPTGAQNPPPKDKDEVVRISVTLVQVDAVVTDRKGRYVTNLKPDDFEITEDGKRQTLTNFSYIEAQPATPDAPAAAAGKPDRHAAPMLPPALSPAQVRRTIALVVDDLGLSFESTAYVRAALKKYVDEQMQPGDLVAIVRTSAGVGTLQQFTADKRLLSAAVERVRWNGFGRSSVAAFSLIGGGPQRSIIAAGDDPERVGETLEQFRGDLFTVGALGTMDFIVRALRELPGRKSIVLFSDGFRLFSGSRADLNQRAIQAVRRLTDLANRASVVIYTMDARGLQTTGLTAADQTNGMSPQAIRDEALRRTQELFNTQEGLQYLAAQTGGFFIRDTNDLNRGLRRVFDDQRGYYLLGYVPQASSFRATRDGVPFHKIHVGVKDGGLRVRSRTGFYGVSDEVMRPAPRTPVAQLLGALTSPFAAGDIRLKLTSLFGHDPKAGDFVRALLHIDPSAITFTQGPDGEHKAAIDIAAFTFGDNGQVVNQESREYSFHVSDAAFARFMREGLLYNLSVPIKKPGAYQLRIAVRDTASAKIGSASQFVEVPDVKRRRLALSGIICGSSIGAAKPGRQAATPVGEVAEGDLDRSDVQSGPSERLFRPGMQLRYGLAIYNAAVKGAPARPQLESQVVVWRDGKAVYTSNPAAIDLTGQTDWQQVAAGGQLQLGTKMEPGHYVLQVIITDRLADNKYNTATQWIDFDVAN